MTDVGGEQRGASGVRRVLTIVAVLATLVGLPAVLITGALLRHVGHVAPSVTNATELRQRVIAHGIDCDDPKDTTKERDGARTALVCGQGSHALRLAAYVTEAAREKAPIVFNGGWYVDGANWRIYTTDKEVAHRLARVLTGRANGYVV